MKKYYGRIIIFLTVALLSCALFLCSCSATTTEQVYIVSIGQTGSNGLEDIYTITYSDGTTDTFTVTNGRDGSDGEDCTDGTAITILDVYEQYKQYVGSDELTLEEFLSEYLSFSDETTALAIQKNLLSVMKIYSEFVVSETYPIRPGQSYKIADTMLCSGSAVIYDMDVSDDGYTYVVTNYHVVYLDEADADYNDGTKIARKIYGYLYGSEGTPSVSVDENTNVVNKDPDGCTVYDYGDYVIGLEYIGGSIFSDIAVLRVKTDEILEINPYAKEVSVAESYYVGETAVAIGNPESLGISVTQGIISVENDYISLDIDGTVRSYRSIRIDTPLYSGNSGGGLFNAEGEQIGITNAGNTSDENINYAVPIEIVCGTADNIIYYFEKGYDTRCAYKITLGITVQSQNSKFVYDSLTGYGKICEEVVLSAVSEGSIAEKMGLEAGDILSAIIVNDTEYTITRTFNISDLILTLREGDTIRCEVERGDMTVKTSIYTLSETDFAVLE